LEFLKVAAYLQKHAVPATFVAFLVAPATWGIVSLIHSEQFRTFEQRIELLRERLDGETQAREKAQKELALMNEISARALRPTRSTDFTKLFNASPNAAAIAKALQ
jgi:hypothetical protein